MVGARDPRCQRRRRGRARRGSRREGDPRAAGAAGDRRAASADGSSQRQGGAGRRGPGVRGAAHPDAPNPAETALPGEATVGGGGGAGGAASRGASQGEPAGEGVLAGCHGGSRRALSRHQTRQARGPAPPKTAKEGPRAIWVLQVPVGRGRVRLVQPGEEEGGGATQEGPGAARTRQRASVGGTGPPGGAAAAPAPGALGAPTRFGCGGASKSPLLPGLQPLRLKPQLGGLRGASGPGRR